MYVIDISEIVDPDDNAATSALAFNHNGFNGSKFNPNKLGYPKLLLSCLNSENCALSVDHRYS